MKSNLSCVSCCVLFVVLLVSIVIPIYYPYHKTVRQFVKKIHGGFLIVLKILREKIALFSNASLSRYRLSCCLVCPQSVVLQRIIIRHGTRQIR
jgi:hypothetical protein